MAITTKQQRPKQGEALVPVQRQGVETADSGRVQRLIENDQRRNPTAGIAENAVRHLAETRQSQKSVTQTCGTSRCARGESHAAG